MGERRKKKYDGISMDFVRSFADTQKKTQASAFLQPVTRKEANSDSKATHGHFRLIRKK